jgi:hypothetical protein
MRSSLADDSGPCAGATLGLAIALREVTLTPRLGWCRAGFANPGIHATLDQYDAELSAAHVWDLGVVSLEVGVTAGGSLLVQRFKTQGIAPRRSTAALQLSPTVGVTRELGERSYLFLLGSGSTFLFRSQDTATSRASFGPSFALRVAAGAGLRL